MKSFLKEIESAHGAGLYRLSLFGTLALPDICAALRLPGGHAIGKNKELYIKWYEEYVTPRYNILSAQEAYDWRCSALHQGTSIPQKQEEKNYNRVVFSISPNIVLNIRRHFSTSSNETFIHADLRMFIPAVINATKDFYEANKDSEIFKKNIATFIKIYPKGLYQVQGFPVIA